MPRGATSGDEIRPSPQHPAGVLSTPTAVEGGPDVGAGHAPVTRHPIAVREFGDVMVAMPAGDQQRERPAPTAIKGTPGGRRAGGARVVAIDPQRDPRWEAFVTAHPDGVVYHRAGWLRVIEETFGYRPRHLAYQQADGALGGVLPLFETRGLLSGRQLSSLPHTPVAGPLAHDGAAMNALLQAAVTRVRRTSGAQLQLKLSSEEMAALVDGVTVTPWRASYVTALPERPQVIRFGNSRNHSAVKRAVAKAERAGVRVRPAERPAELRAWYLLYLETMRWNGIPPLPYRFFTAMWRHLRPDGLMRLLLAEQHGDGPPRLLAGALLLMSGDTVFYGFSGRRLEDLALRPNDAIHWRAIHDACAEGYRSYDFGEVAGGNEGLTQFKSKWGTAQRQLYRAYYPAPREVESGVLGQRGRVRQLVNAAWRRAPLPLTEAIGPKLYRYL